MGYFLASKTVGIILTPSSLAALLVVAGLLLAAARRRAGFTLATFGALALAAMGFGPVGTLLARPLEDRFPACPADLGDLAGIVVLGGSVSPDATWARGALQVPRAAERLLVMADLARNHPQVPVLFTGGSANLVDEPLPEADAIEAHLDLLDLPPGRITFERQSRNTYENALFSARILGPAPGRRFLVVTSALHMPRSVGLFRAAGFDVVPCPAGYLTTGRVALFQPRLSDGLALADAAAREWLGLVASRLFGQSRSWFPAPGEAA